MARRATKPVVAAGVVALTLGFGTGVAQAAHDHYIVTPGGGCHQVAPGQTGLPAGHGGDHRFHLNVHWGATEDDQHRVLGKGNSRVELYAHACPAP